MAFLVSQAFDYLQRSFQENRLAHAYLITGPEGSGKEQLALQLIRLTNDLSSERLEDLRDPHVQLIRPESRSRRITVDQIRALEKQLHLSGMPGMTKIGVIVDADRLQTASENAFLKTLEEPPPGVLLLLLSSQPEQLLDTILSRCILVPLYLPGHQGPTPTPAIAAFLEAAGNHLASGQRSLSRALTLARTFTLILKQEKEEVAKDNDAALKEEMAKYRETTDGDWLKRREIFYKDRTESEYVQRRTAMLEMLLGFLGDAVRLQSGYDRVDFRELSPLTKAIAQGMPSVDLNKRFAALEDLRGHLETNVLDALAIEVGFLKAFA